MTISYSGNYANLIFRWKGSVLKVVWRELIVYMFLFFVIRMIIQFESGDGSKESAKKVVDLFHSFTKAVPLTFLVGVFVATVVIRWNQIIKNVPWPDDIMLLVNAYLPGKLPLRLLNVEN